MENILKLTVKKEVFDKLASGEQNYVYVEENNYWIKRLAANSVDGFQKLKVTQAFKTFDSVSVTCGKENAQYQFKTIKTGHEDMGTNDGWDTGFCIWITGNKNETEEIPAEVPNTVSDTLSNDEPVNEPVNSKLHEAPMEESVEDYVEIDSNETESEDVDAETPNTVSDAVSNGEPIDEHVNEPVNSEDNEEPKEVLVEDETEIDNGSLKSGIDFLIDVIGGYDNVIIVNRPNIIITSNGRIFGTKDRLDINNDEEIRVNVGTEKLYDDTNNDKDFLEKIEKYLMDYTKSGCIFIYKEGCDVVYTEEGRYLKMKMTKKMYLNR